ncbi:MAG: hypothetical protein AAGC95_11960 [Pseudomonadota bacterium]
MARVALAHGAAALALFGCAETWTGPFGANQAGGLQSGDMVVAIPVAPAAVKSRRTPMPEDLAALPTPRVKPVQTFPLAELVGETPDAVGQRLGAPDEIKTDSPALTWVFANELCTLRVAFYASVEEENYRALQYAVAPAEGGEIGGDAAGSPDAERACLEKVLVRAANR